MKTETKAKNEIARQLKLDLDFYKKDVETMEQLKCSIDSWYYKEKLTPAIIRNIRNGKYATLREAKAVIYKRLQKFYDNKLTKILEEIAELKAINPKSCNWGECAIDWTKNSTWGNCPRGSYRNGHAYSEYRSVTGCGYDKLSTLTARMFNEDKCLMSYILHFVECYNITQDNIRERLGYGIRISNTGMPYFEGAVGIECHKRILQNLGFKVTHNETRKSDFISFERIIK